jgi:F-type H+-transporting ATPase subunit delta
MAAVSIRYARAFADSIFDRKVDAGQAVAQLNEVVTLLQQSLPLREVWENAAVPAEQKRAVLDKIVARAGMQPLLRNFIAVIIDHRRVAQLSEIAAAFEAEVNQRLGLAEAEVTSARELSQTERSALEAKVASVTGKSIRASYRVDAAVLGGAVIRVGSTVFDGSVKGQLQKIKEQLVAEA